jgi:undecaprenyl-diphosphatase
MKKENQRNFWGMTGFLLAFAVWTLLVSTVDVKAIGPLESSVGFATVNGWVHRLTGVHMALYTITDWLGLVPFFVAMGFGFLGLFQWISRKNLCKVDYSILVLGGFYLVTVAAYLLFEQVVINYRPVLINGYLEVSYPSSTTLLSLCVMPTAVMQLKNRVKNKTFGQILWLTMIGFTVFMVIARLVSGVHWVTDIVGGILLSTGLVLGYRFGVNLQSKDD